MTIKRATFIETQEILEHALEIFQESTVGYGKATIEKAKRLTNTFLENGGFFFVYKERNVLQGWIGIITSYDIYSDQWIGFIQELYVLPAYRKKGLGEKLCNKAIEYFKQNHYKEVHLNVFAGNHAKQLYEKLNFQDYSTLMKLDLNFE